MRMITPIEYGMRQRRKTMRRVVAAFVGVTALSVVAKAADLPRAPLYTPPPMPVAYNWTGCYLGVHAGGGWSVTDWTNTTNTTAFGDLAPGQGYRQTNSGFIGGGQVGCNYQIDSWVLGLEASFAGTSVKGDVNNTAFGAANDVFTARINSLLMVTGRVGYAFDNWLVYAKGGYAGADVNFSVTDPAGSGNASSWQSGWTVGGGVEYGITRNWIVGVEYDFIDLSSKNYNVSGGAGTYAFDVQPQIHQVVARLSYKF
jgi:outer membrane immunogenic protein